MPRRAGRYSGQPALGIAPGARFEVWVAAGRLAQVAARVALPRVPEFATAPSTPPLLYEPSLGRSPWSPGRRWWSRSRPSR
ncbi:hypothetical protein [Spongiactinospora sp. 9N601]|uniref:hypothetical protein n=1 Tax=Spongiactinospora sp. 9N601 TaxID=3375149 RepID=UPI00379FDB46